MEKSDSTVEDTNSEALISKISAINLGYYRDPFAKKFCRANLRKDCIINRGYWARVQAFKELIERFFTTYKNEKCQIISLGCGYDTLYFQLKSSQQFDFDNIVYYEIDLPTSTKRKIMMIQKDKELVSLITNNNSDNSSFIESIQNHGSSLNTKDYRIIGQDLRSISKVKEDLEKFGINYETPTLVFAECVLIYLTNKESNDIIKYFNESYQNIYFANYEMLKLDDPFGKIMIKNFEAKGCELLGIHDYPNIESQKIRYSTLGFTNVEVYDILTMYNKYLSQDERKRIERIEWLDELEEWQLITKHYYFSLASKLDSMHQANRVKLYYGKEVLEPVKPFKTNFQDSPKNEFKSPFPKSNNNNNSTSNSSL